MDPFAIPPHIDIERALGNSYSNDTQRLDAAVSVAMGLLKQRGRRSGHEREDMATAEHRFRIIRRYLVNSSVIQQDARDFLNRYVTLQDYWARCASSCARYRDRDALVDDAFRTTLIRFDDPNPAGAIDGEALTDLSMAEAQRLWDRARRRLADGDTKGAVTLARTLLDTVSKLIIGRFRETTSMNDTPAHLVRRAMKLALPANVTGDEHFLKFAQSAATLVQHIALYRNATGDAHATAAAQIVDRHHAEYAVNLAGSTALFLAQCVEDVTKTSR